MHIPPRCSANFVNFLPAELQLKFNSDSLDLPSFIDLFEKYTERISYLGQMLEEPILGELLTLHSSPVVDLNLIYSELDHKDTESILETLYSTLNSLGELTWNSQDLKESLSDIIKEKGTKNVLWPLRTALSGQKKSLDPFSLLSILGKEESLERIQAALIEIKK